MPYSKSLRAIGQSLEFLHIDAFVIEKRGQNFIVRSESLPPHPEATLKKTLVDKVWDFSGPDRQRAMVPGGEGWLLYSPPYLSWLDARGRRKRRRRFSTHASGSKTLSQRLRTLGKYLDRVDTNSFQVRWATDSVFVDYELTGGNHIRESLSMAKLRELGLRMRYRRAPRR
jgi:hypothetical protein